MESGIRSPAVAGTFYPNNPKELRSMMDTFFTDTKQMLSGKTIKALIVPHAGYEYSGQTAAWGYQQLRTSKLESRHSNFVLIGPSHNFGFTGMAGDTHSQCITPFGSVPHIPAIPNKTIALDGRSFIPEHCLEVQLPFLQHICKDFSISCFLTGSTVDEKSSADYFLQNYAHSTLIISSDLSHYLPDREAKDKDRKTIEAINNFDNDYFHNEDNVACGAVAISILLTIAKQEHWKSKLIYYDTSSTYSGNTNQVVGYASIAFHE